MIPALAAALTGRFTFVLGKGGVGKSTTAAAVALWRADGGEATHFISTDPAHSLADVLGHPAGAEPRASPCSPRLVVEELDANAWSARWLAAAGEPLAELVERGTYLRPEEVRGFLELAYPGVDEVAAALRLAELERTDADRIVVDTAPTGHALRLLDAGSLLDGWLGAFDAMRDKAGAVAEALTGAPARWAADQVLKELEAGVDAFRRRVLADADFIVVTRPGEVVEAETRRLEAELRRRGLRVAARLVTGGEEGGAGDEDHAERPRITVPWRVPLPGCEDLRSWGAPAPAPAVKAASAEEQGSGVERGTAADPHGERIRRLLDRELILVAGKGGVGKSTCAAALAVALARDRSVALVGTDPAGSLADVLGEDVPPDGLRLGDRLWVRELDAETLFSRFRAEYQERIEAVFRELGVDRSLALDRRVLEELWSLAPPGMDEIFALVRVLDAVEEQETVVVDAAPTGHFLRLLAMPELAADWTRQVLRLMVQARELGGMEGMTEGLLTFARRLRRLRETLASPERAGVLVVTLDEPVVRAETERLARSLSEAGVPVAAVLLNRSTGRPSGAQGPAGTRLTAPELSPAPRGRRRLQEFFDTWTVALPATGPDAV